MPDSRRESFAPGPRAALIVADVQNDFCEGGSLPVVDGDAVAAAIARYLEASAEAYEAVISTRDFHVDPGAHFASTTGAPPDYADTWPDHCVAGTSGAELHPALAPALARHGDAEFLKGRDSASYSGFDGLLASDGQTLLVTWLRARGVRSVVVVGIATDFCVRATVLDALAAGFPATVLTDLCAGVSTAGARAALEVMAGAGARLARAGVGAGLTPGR